MTGEKTAIRRSLRDQRKRLPRDIVAAAEQRVLSLLRGLSAYQRARSVICYLATDNEVPTEHIVEEVVAAGRLLFVPRMEQRPLLARWHPGEPLERGPGGVPQPLASKVAGPLPPAVFLLPLVAWDAGGTRLGRGGGFYDRLCTGDFASVPRVGLAYEFQRVERLPRDPWDVCMHYVITECRVVYCAVGMEADGPARQEGGLEQ
jgi:5-formyltetrahydrofolate cyclo-ligase